MQCARPITLKFGEIVPCGKCPQCLANQRQEWVFRLQQEYMACKFGLFLTLTYSDDTLPSDGVSKRDVQLFLKRLRKHFAASELRYYIVSEYGDHTHRPHYHGLLFFKNKHDNKRVIYDIITESWQKGFCQFGEVEEGSIVYCTKYCLKKCIVPEGQNPVFRLVSKMNGGIGANYLNSMLQHHSRTLQLSSVSYMGRRCRMPKYYRDKSLDERFGKHRNINPSYLNYRIDKRIQSFNEQSSELREEMIHYFKTHHFSTYEEASAAWCNELNARKRRESELIVKHTKKQVL